MPQAYGTMIAAPELFGLVRAASATTQVVVFGDGTFVWSDAATDAYTPATIITSAYDGTVTIDCTALFWVLVARKGKMPVLVHQADVPTMDTVLGPGVSWALLRRIEVGELLLVSQI